MLLLFIRIMGALMAKMMVPQQQRLLLFIRIMGALMAKMMVPQQKRTAQL